MFKKISRARSFAAVSALRRIRGSEGGITVCRWPKVQMMRVRE
jgi:hypothetical protein